MIIGHLFFQITLKLEPLFKRSITYVEKDDSDLGDQAAAFGDAHEFGDILWYPSQRKVLYRVDDRVPTNTSGNGLYDIISFRPTPSNTSAFIRTRGLPSFIELKFSTFIVIKYTFNYFNLHFGASIHT